MPDDARPAAGSASGDRAGERRDGVRDRRDRAGDRRDGAGDRRDEAGSRRDDAGDSRDGAAEARDGAADLRDAVAAARDRAGDERDAAATTRDGLDEHLRSETAPEATARAARTRVDAAADRHEAAQDRGAGAEERRRSEDDRRTSLADRRAGAEERVEAEVDRSTAMADRDAGASERTEAERDRSTALADRGASARHREISSLDDLTGAYHRDAGFAELERAIAGARSSGVPVTLAFADIDGLKAVNDAGGHAAGDRLLVTVAEALKAALHGEGLLVRYGGDEFVCVLPGLDLDAAAQRLAGVGSVTLGLAELRPEDSVSTLIARADAELYERRSRRRAPADD